MMVGRYQDEVDEVTQLLEAAGYIVASTLDDGVAIDMAASSGYEALLVGGEVSQSDRRYITSEARLRNPALAVLIVHSPQSVLTQLSQMAKAT